MKHSQRNNIGTNAIVVGKIPGYNKNIQNAASESVDRPKIPYTERLRNNLTTVRLIPTGYSINFAKLGDEITGDNLEGDTSFLLDADANIYKIGRDLALGSALEAVTSVKSKTALDNWKLLLHAQSSLDGSPGLAAAMAKSMNVNEIRILATNDSTMTEVFSNTFQMSSAERAANKISEYSLADKLATLKKAVTVDSSLGLQMLNSASDITQNQFMNLVAGKALGIQTTLPEEWMSSEYNNTLQLMIKLVSPSGDEASIIEYILKPLIFLILTTSPVTYDGINFGYPTLWQVEADGLMDIELAGVSSLTITRGGTETQFNRYNQPLNIDVRMTISPLVKGFASAVSKNLEGPSHGLYPRMLASNPELLTQSFIASKDSDVYKSIKI